MSEAISGKEKAMKTLFVVIILALFAAPAFGQDPTYGGVTLQPGDVIALQGGPVSLITQGLRNLPIPIPGESPYPVEPQKIGHVCMYLGNNKFLDFNIDNKGKRIADEKQFLSANSKLHPRFEVFHPQGLGKLDVNKMLNAAKEIEKQRYAIEQRVSGGGKGNQNCASAIERVLNAGSTSGKHITLKMPDDVLKKDFARSPQMGKGPIQMSTALRDAEPRVDVGNKAGSKSGSQSNMVTRPKTSQQSSKQSTQQPPKRSTQQSSKQTPRQSDGCPPGYYKCGRLC
jgi:hypothetical protein